MEIFQGIINSVPEFGIHLIHILDHPNQINCMLRTLMKAEAKFLSYWSRILFLLFAVRRHQFCIVQYYTYKKIQLSFESLAMYIGKTDWFTVWANGKQNSEVYHLHKEFHILPKNGCEGLKFVSKMALKKCNMNFHLEHFVGRNRSGLPFQMFMIICLHGCNICPRSKFYLPTELFWKRFLNSKRPLIVLFKSCFCFNLLRNCNCQSKKWCSNRKSACKYLSWSRDLLAWVGTKARHFSIKDLQH